MGNKPYKKEKNDNLDEIQNQDIKGLDKNEIIKKLNLKV